MPGKKKGLYANIHAKKKRIKAGSGETMRKKGAKGAPAKGIFSKIAKAEKKAGSGEQMRKAGSKGAPTKKAFDDSAKDDDTLKNNLR